jgi:hypothetical protein
MTEDQIKHMVNRFLGWRLPAPWHPDNGISYNRPNYSHAPTPHDWPSGTNLFDATQADAMVRHMIAGMPEAAPQEPSTVVDSLVVSLSLDTSGFQAGVERLAAALKQAKSENLK